MRRIGVMGILAAFAVCGIAAGQDDEEAEFVPTFPNPRPAMMAPLAPRGVLLDIVNTGEQLLAVGMYGHILRSDDGRDWTQVESPISSMINRVRMLDAKTGWAVGHDLSILKTGDGGNSWVLQNFDGKVGRPLYDIHMADARNGIAVGSYGMYLVTADGGANWEWRDFPFSDLEMHLNTIIRLGDGSLFIAGERGLMVHSVDGGETWRMLKPPYTGSFFGALAFGERGVLLHGLRGSLYVADDVANVPETGPEEYEFFENRQTHYDAESLAPYAMRYLENDVNESLFGGFWVTPTEAVLVGVNGAVRRVDVVQGTVTAVGTPADEVLQTAIGYQGRLLAVGRRGVQDLGTVGEGH